MAETKFCPRCKTDVPIADWYRNAARLDGLSAYCRACYRVMERAGSRARRAAIVAALGGQCARCGFDDIRALQIDHVHGGGAQQRKAQTGGSAKFYAFVLSHRDDFQILCANCNWIKKAEDEEHVGARDYGRVPPTERISRARRTHDPEVNAARGEAMRKRHAARSPEAEAERRRKISETKRARAAEREDGPPDP